MNFFSNIVYIDIEQNKTEYIKAIGFFYYLPVLKGKAKIVKTRH